ncbi:putative Protein CHROMATIN REMODELING 24 [Blattamonas nauphoetae]|uniref:Uncharacterized protein n=1 Tax=Blattamonas nauphoetae TaxID=2049346 RepID=A0ABQ9YEV2_9EUKA|nr:putative Protein CHROMATIN REMODELING 24 [Blattamonas nauphoetae]
MAVVLTKEQKIKYNGYVSEASTLRHSKLPDEQKRALQLFELAYEIYQGDRKLLDKISKLKALLKPTQNPHLNQIETQEPIISLEQTMSKLYPYQRKGVEWMFSLVTHRGPTNCPGGILADEMGLGKTVQVCAFLTKWLDYRRQKGLFANAKPPPLRVLLALPLSLMCQWAEELGKWTPELPQEALYSLSPLQRNSLFQRLKIHGGIAITTYGSLHSLVGPLQDSGIIFDAMIYDEGHKLKNHTSQAAKAGRQIPAKYRFLLTGTPIQNNLKEFWSLFAFIAGGNDGTIGSGYQPNFATNKLLGTLTDFNSDIITPIQHAQLKNATVEQKVRGENLSRMLRETVGPYFLRREKVGNERMKQMGTVRCVEVMADGTKVFENEADEAEWKKWEEERTKQGKRSEVKSEEAKDSECYSVEKVLCWIPPSPIQLEITKTFIESPEVQEIINRSKFIFGAITVLRKICHHPWLLFKEDVWLRPPTGVPQFEETFAPGGSPGDDLSETRPTTPTAIQTPFTTPEEQAALTKKTNLAPILGQTSLANSDKFTLSDAKAASLKLEMFLNLLHLIVEGMNETTIVFCESARMLRMLKWAIEEEWADSNEGQDFDPLLTGHPPKKPKPQLPFNLFLMTGSTPVEERNAIVKFFLRDTSELPKNAEEETDMQNVQAHREKRLAEMRKRMPRRVFEALTHGAFDSPMKGRNGLSNSARHLAERPSVLLLSTRVGGVGLTLTKATSVICYSPSWNPAVDAQAIGRVDRIGQVENVSVYRLLCCGLIEEKMARRQLQKERMMKETVSAERKLSRYFRDEDLRELLRIGMTEQAMTHIMIGLTVLVERGFTEDDIHCQMNMKKKDHPAREDGTLDPTVFNEVLNGVMLPKESVREKMEMLTRLGCTDVTDESIIFSSVDRSTDNATDEEIENALRPARRQKRSEQMPDWVEEEKDLPTSRGHKDMNEMNDEELSNFLYKFFDVTRRREETRTTVSSEGIQQYMNELRRSQMSVIPQDMKDELREEEEFFGLGGKTAKLDDGTEMPAPNNLSLFDRLSQRRSSSRSPIHSQQSSPIFDSRTSLPGSELTNRTRFSDHYSPPTAKDIDWDSDDVITIHQPEMGESQFDDHVLSPASEPQSPPIVPPLFNRPAVKSPPPYKSKMRMTDDTVYSSIANDNSPRRSRSPISLDDSSDGEDGEKWERASLLNNMLRQSQMIRGTLTDDDNFTDTGLPAIEEEREHDEDSQSQTEELHERRRTPPPSPPNDALITPQPSQVSRVPVTPQPSHLSRIPETPQFTPSILPLTPQPISHPRPSNLGRTPQTPRVVLHPRSSLQRAEVMQYNALLLKAKGFELENDLDSAITSLEQALQICDDDPKLIMKMQRITRQMANSL